ncbi:aminoglycoside phosphotransferase family protein [Nocardioides bruguierae]|uniref:aminoglycoside phosphotransferase family protein n=1 Tax=Nocardioides bruguierae TaxID=2945102 RepID=UPI00201FD42A|nr:aminoglycoside phosphotransferase family protein [Nocardioides bruguierae]MCL8024145.1 aminoglycoside phosphotransferase family protein [Nocardioides bruguierae]
MSAPPRLQPLTRARVADLGEAGAAWHAALPGVLDALADRWELAWGRPLPGGSASYVLAATTRAGQERVLKVRLPEPGLGEGRDGGEVDEGGAVDEVRVLRAADGRGYARLHAHVPASDLGLADGADALLLERLGPSLDATGGSVEDRLTVLARTLREAWQVPPPPAGPREDKALSLARSVRETDARLGGATDPAALREALAAAERLAGWAGATVTVHGDAHSSNLLRTRDGRGTGWAFVDPDGFACDPAYDLGVAVRDWSSHLRGADARARLRGWCGLLATATGLDARRIWDWAYLERVSTGLYVSGFGARTVGRPFLETAAGLV